MKKSQFSMEYIMILGVILVLIIPLYYYASNKYVQEAKIDIAENAVQNLKDVIDGVYSLGPGNQAIAGINLPGGINDFRIENLNTLVLNVNVRGESTSFHATTLAQKLVMDSGDDLPVLRGNHKIIVEYLNDGSNEIELRVVF